MSQQAMNEILSILNHPELTHPNTYMISLLGTRLIKDYWEGEMDAHAQFLTTISSHDADRVCHIVRTCPGEVIESDEVHLTKIIGSYKAIYNFPPVSSEHTFSFHLLGAEGFPWPIIKDAFVHKWPFVLNEESLVVYEQQSIRKEYPSNYSLLRDVRGALHRNLKRLDTVLGVFQDIVLPVSTYTLISEDNVIVYHANSMVKELHFMPKI